MSAFVKALKHAIGLTLILMSVTGCVTSTAGDSVNPFCILGVLTYTPEDTVETQEWGDGFRAVYEEECG